MNNVIDLVCGMNVDRDHFAFRSRHEGQTYYFCSQFCQDSFDKDPQHYVGRSNHDQDHNLDAHTHDH